MPFRREAEEDSIAKGPQPSRRSISGIFAKFRHPPRLVFGIRSHPLDRPPLAKIYQRHDYAAEVKAAFEKWSAPVTSLVANPAKAAA